MLTVLLERCRVSVGHDCAVYTFAKWHLEIKREYCDLIFPCKELIIITACYYVRETGAMVEITVLDSIALGYTESMRPVAFL